MFGGIFSRRTSLPCLLILAVPLIAGCELRRGASGRDAEWARLQSDAFFVVRASHKGAVIAARGQKVAVDPAPGFCLAEDSIETSKRSVFMLIGDCAVEAPTGDRRGSRGELQLPKAVPGIMTVSISGDPGFRSTDGSYDKLHRFLKSPEGKAMLGRSGSGESVEIKESREMDGALLLYLEDRSTDIVPILSNQFWRAFVELNGRLAVVTISGFRDRPLGRERMLAYLINQVQTLGVANSTPLGPVETLVARADIPSETKTDAGPRKLSEVKAEAVAAGATKVTTVTPDNEDGEIKVAEVADASEKTDADAEPPESRETPPAGEETATTSGPEPEIRRGTSPLERRMVLPPRRPGARRTEFSVAETKSPAIVAERETEPAVDTTAPFPAVKTGSVSELVLKRPVEKVAVVATADSGTEPVTGPATKYAPKTAPIAPKPRR